MHFPQSYQGGGYLALSQSERKTTASLDTVLQDWKDEDEIKYHSGDNDQTSYYYSDSQKPEGLLESGRRFFAHLTNPDARDTHSRAIDAVVKDLKNQSTLPSGSLIVREDFKFHKMLGQPLSVGALKTSIQKVSSKTTRSTLADSRPRFFIFGKIKNPGHRANFLKRLARPSPEKKGYQRIGGDDSSTSSNPLSSSGYSYQSGGREIVSLRDQDVGPL